MTFLRPIFYGFKNAQQASNEPPRALVSGAHAINAADDIAKSSLGGISEVAGRLVNSIDDVGEKALQSVFKLGENSMDDIGENVIKSTSKLDKFVKVSEFTSRAVNPLLCLASGVRVLGDEDKSSALVEETMAMSAMFGAEIAINSVKKPMEALIKAGHGNLDDVVKELAASKKLTDKISSKIATTFLGNDKIKSILKTAVENIGKLSKGKKTLLFIGADLLLVAASICLFDAGKKIGKKITGRDKLAEVTQSVQSNENFFTKKS